jgi:hypothetical protein
LFSSFLFSRIFSFPCPDKELTSRSLPLSAPGPGTNQVVLPFQPGRLLQKKVNACPTAGSGRRTHPFIGAPKLVSFKERGARKDGNNRGLDSCQREDV